MIAILFILTLLAMSVTVILTGKNAKKWRNCKKKEYNTIPFTFTTNFITIKSKHMSVTLEVGQHAVGALAPKKVNGDLAPIQTGTATFTSSDETVATVTQNPDNELEVTVKVVGVGTATITGTVDADPGEGVRTLTASAEVSGTQALARTLDFAFGAAQD
jgi:hypothetical protein